MVPTKILVVAFAILLAQVHSSIAATQVLTATQLLGAFVSAGDDFQGCPPTGIQSVNIHAGILSPRSTSISATGGCNSNASAAVSHTGTATASGFNFQGHLEAHQSGGLPQAITSLSLNFDFDVVNQMEIVTLTLSSFSASSDDGTLLRLKYSITDRDGNPVSDGNLSTGALLQIQLAPGQYHLELLSDAGPIGNYDAGNAVVNFTAAVSFSNVVFMPGSLQSHPLLPAQRGVFVNVPGQRWFDPPAVSEFSFQMTGGSLFTEIMTFPTGFGNSFEVRAEGQSLGNFTANQSVNFVLLLGHGVSSFVVRNITPPVDAADTRAFPIQLDFDTPTADFLMIPNPGVFVTRRPNGDFAVNFAGILQQSNNLSSPSNWVTVPGSPASPLVVPAASAGSRLFFRTVQN